MDNPFEPRGLTARQRRIGEARDHAMLEYDRTGEETLPIAVGLFPDENLTPEQTERMWAHREELYLEDALAVLSDVMAEIKARIRARSNGDHSVAAAGVS